MSSAIPRSEGRPAATAEVSRPMVSFVMPVLNGERYIGRCLDAIRGLTRAAADYEIIVVDNGSTDGTLAILQSAGVQYSVIPGITVGELRNRGAHMARGEYLAFVDSDVEVKPSWLGAGLAALDDRGVVAAGCFPTVPSDATWVQRVWDLHQRSRRPEGAPKPVAWLSSMNLIVRRADFLAVGGFAQGLETAEDVDLCYRLGTRGRIMYSAAMDAVHWGEARDVRIFWRKEVWRGKGNLHGLWSHGLRWDELPSVLYPLYVLGALAFLAVGLAVDLWRGEPRLAPAGLAALALPALLLAMSAAWQSRRVALIPHFTFLYALYGFARARALLSSPALTVRPRESR
jgi:glycosyltransferase involved in cell wall biosynthesis